jgi:Bacterial regulatory proteins, luxR family
LGKGNKEIAWDLKLSTGTIKQYLYRICVKLDCHNRTAVAIRTAISFGPFRQDLLRRDGGARGPALVAIITPILPAVRLDDAASGSGGLASAIERLPRRPVTPELCTQPVIRPHLMRF